jgi:transposase InsO family protein
MSRSGNCQDNIVIEGFFLLLTQERIKRKTNVSRAKKGKLCFTTEGNPRGQPG